MERPLFDRPEPKTKREVLDALGPSVAAALEFLRGLDDARAMQPWSMTLEGKPLFTLPRIWLIRNIMLNHSDINATSSTDINDQLICTIFDNVTVVPEPATTAVLGIGALALLRRKRK